MKKSSFLSFRFISISLHFPFQLLSSFSSCLSSSSCLLSLSVSSLIFILSLPLSHLSSFILSCLVLSCLVLSCLVLSCLVLSCLVLSCLVLSCLVLSCLVLSCLVLSCLVLSCPVLSCLVSLSLSVSVCCVVLCCVVLCCVVCVVVVVVLLVVAVCVCVCLVSRLRVYIQNVPEYAGTTRSCVETCARGAGTHRDVLNVHTGTFGIHTRVAGVIVSNAYQNLPTYGYHVLQRFTKETFGSYTFSVRE